MKRPPKRRINWAPSKGAAEQDKKTLSDWEDENITTAQAIRAIKDNNHLYASDITEDEFIRNAHWLGYYQKSDWRLKLEENGTFD